MKKDVDRMNMLIKYREQIENDFQKECNKMHTILMIEEEKLSSLELAQERSIIELQEKQDADISLHDACIYYSFLNSITQEINKQKDQLRDIQEQFEEKRKVLVAAHQDKRIVEILKEKMQQEILKCEEKKEVKFMDDLSGQKYFKKQKTLKEGTND